MDLRSSYHQVRMSDENIENITFRTYQERYKVKVMLFGLTNAPTTFQELMNIILEPFLRKFVLIFFDDILIYSCTYELHVIHLRLVLKTLSANQLYEKKSKYTFSQQQVEYIRHVISIQGVVIDSNKIKVVQN